jgi:hypothetical protein
MNPLAYWAHSLVMNQEENKAQTRTFAQIIKIRFIIEGRTEMEECIFVYYNNPIGRLG